MRVEKISKIQRMEGLRREDLADQKFGDLLREKRRRFQERLQQDAREKNGEPFDKKRAEAEADTARLAAKMRIERIDSEEQQK